MQYDVRDYDTDGVLRRKVRECPGIFKSKKGFGYGVGKSKVRPSNLSTRDTEAVLAFPMNIRVGTDGG